MRNYFMRWLAVLAVFLLTAGCGRAAGSTGDERSFQAKILEISDGSVLVEALEGEEVRNSSDQFSFGTADLDDIGAETGDVVHILFTGGIMESYPAQIQAVSWSLVEKASAEQGETLENGGEDVSKDSSGATALPERQSECGDITFSLVGEPWPGGGVFEMTYTGDHDTVWYYDEFFTLERYENGDWVELSMTGGLCGTTSYMKIPEEVPGEVDLNWGMLYGPLEPGVYCVTKEVFPQRVGVLNKILGEAMPEERDALRSTGPDTDAGVWIYAVFELKEGLGLGLEAQDVSSGGLTLKFVRDGGKPSGDLQYGSSYFLQRLEDGRWVAVEYASPDQEIAWDEIAYFIPEEGSEQEINWELLYGQLPSGQYRIFKDIMDFRKSGDYDIYSCFAEFVIP